MDSLSSLRCLALYLRCIVEYRCDVVDAAPSAPDLFIDAGYGLRVNFLNCFAASSPRPLLWLDLSSRAYARAEIFLVVILAFLKAFS